MRTTKRGTLPATRSASAMAASLPEGSISPYSSVSSLTYLPAGSTPTLEPAALTALGVMRTCPEAGWERTRRRAVIILASEAIGSRWVELIAHSTRPLLRSKSSAARGGWWKCRERRAGEDGPVAALLDPDAEPPRA